MQSMGVDINGLVVFLRGEAPWNSLSAKTRAKTTTVLMREASKAKEPSADVMVDLVQDSEYEGELSL